MLFISIFLFLIVYDVNGAKIPTYLKPCLRSDPKISDCILKQANELVPKLASGDKRLRFPCISPLKIPQLYIQFPNDLKVEMTNSTLDGLDKAVVKKLEAKFKEDIDNSSVAFQMYIPRINFQGHYDIAGKIFLLPINGQGPANITFMPGLYNLETFFKKVEKKGKIYMVPSKTTLVYETERAYFQLDNLFGGDEILGAQMNEFLNDNWREVNEELGVKVGDTYGVIFTEIFTPMFSKFTYDQLLPKE